MNEENRSITFCSLFSVNHTDMKKGFCFLPDFNLILITKYDNGTIIIKKKVSTLRSWNLKHPFKRMKNDKKIYIKFYQLSSYPLVRSILFSNNSSEKKWGEKLFCYRQNFNLFFFFVLNFVKKSISYFLFFKKKKEPVSMCIKGNFN